MQAVSSNLPSSRIQPRCGVIYVSKGTFCLMCVYYFCSGWGQASELWCLPHGEYFKSNHVRKRQKATEQAHCARSHLLICLPNTSQLWKAEEFIHFPLLLSALLWKQQLCRSEACHELMQAFMDSVFNSLIVLSLPIHNLLAIRIQETEGQAWLEHSQCSCDVYSVKRLFLVIKP